MMILSVFSRARFLTIVLMFVASLGIATLSAQEVVIDEICYQLDGEENTAKVVSKYDLLYTGDVSIPESVTYNGISYTVTGIVDRAFMRCLELTSVSIPGSVASIGNGAFSGCSALASATIANGVASIGEGAFYDCSALASISIPRTVTEIGYNAFVGCTALASIVVDEENRNYDSRNRCNAIIETGINRLIVGCKNSIIPNGVESIEAAAFLNCTELTSINFPNTLTLIGGSAFEGCTGLSSIVLRESVSTIGFTAFYGCTGLTSIVIPKAVKFIGLNAFSNCPELASITVAPGNTVYDSRNNCNAIIETATNILQNGCKNSFIPGTVTEIATQAFFNCTGLTSIDIPESVKKIRSMAFYGCTGLSTVAIPNGIKNIDNEVFYGCTGLTSVSIPETAIRMGGGCFSYCTKLADVYMYAAEPPMAGSDIFKGSENISTIYVPLGVKAVYEKRFWGEYDIVEMDYSGIHNVSSDSPSETSDSPAVYDLNGRCVGTSIDFGILPKGTYIMNGKKVMK